jgi:hypothetical protein
MWILVLVFVYNSPAITTVPGVYSTIEVCEKAATEFEKNSGVFEKHIAYCIPAPDDIAYE